VKFRGNGVITTSYLIAYEQKLKDGNLSKSTIRIYLRPLRAIYNVEDGFAKKDRSYPFRRRKYQIPSARTVKKALGRSAAVAIGLSQLFVHLCLQVKIKQHVDQNRG
jgi:hypothetical protein